MPFQNGLLILARMNEPALPSDRRLPSLDGWRAVSIALVLGSHFTMTQGFPPGWVRLFDWLFDGILGVRCFFVISGLLITWLLLGELARTGSVNLKHFYIRRALRILPVYWVFLAVIAVLSICTQFHQPAIGWVRNLTFTTNFGDQGWTTGHLWSLAVEEQFYLLWPFAFVMLLRARSQKTVYVLVLLTVFATAAISRTACYLKRSEVASNPLFHRFSFFNYWDSVATGCVLAFILTRRPGWLAVPRARPVAWVTTAALLILVPYVLQRLHLLALLTVPFGAGFEALGLGMLLLQSMAEPGLFFYRMLNTPFAKSIGVLSYSIYIWQQLFSTNASSFGWSPARWFGASTWLIPVFLTSYLSYHWLEMPMLRLRRRFRDVTHGDERLPAAPTA